MGASFQHIRPASKMKKPSEKLLADPGLQRTRLFLAISQRRKSVAISRHQILVKYSLGRMSRAVRPHLTESRRKGGLLLWIESPTIKGTLMISFPYVIFLNMRRLLCDASRVDPM
jgi:hypothetical protein